MPLEGKQILQDKDLCNACKVHDIEGHEVVSWCMVMALVGREMLGKHNDRRVNGMFGPLQIAGEQMSPDVFGKVFKEIGRSFFGMGNMSINAMRATQDTIAVEHGIEMGHPDKPQPPCNGCLSDTQCGLGGTAAVERNHQKPRRRDNIANKRMKCPLSRTQRCARWCSNQRNLTSREKPCRVHRRSSRVPGAGTVSSTGMAKLLEITQTNDPAAEVLHLAAEVLHLAPFIRPDVVPVVIDTLLDAFDVQR